MAAMILAVAICVALVSTPLAAQEKVEEVRPPKLNYTTHKLANGLEVILLEDHAVPIINLAGVVPRGLEGRAARAHRIRAPVRAFDVQRLGARGRGRTFADHRIRRADSTTPRPTTTPRNFFETFPSNYLERVLWLEADRMGSLNVSEANFKSEREVVKEERRVRVENQPYGYLQEDLRAAAFTVHGYHHTPIGSMEDLDKATIQDVRDFFNTYYKPNNATLVIVGDFESAQALAWTKKYFDGIPASAKPIPRLDNPEPPQTAERVVKKSYSNTPLPAVVIGYKIPARYAPDAYPLDLASNILAGGESSRLYQTLVYKEQIAVQAAGFGAFSEDPNLFWAYAIMNQGHTAEEGEKALVEVLDGLKTAPVDAKELEKAKNQEISGFVLGRDTDQEKAEALASAAVIGKNPALANTELGHYLTISPEDIQRVAKEYFALQHATVLIVTPAAPAQ